MAARVPAAMAALPWSLLASLMVVVAGAGAEERGFRFVRMAAAGVAGLDAHAWVRPGELLGWCGRRDTDADRAAGDEAITRASVAVGDRVMPGVIAVEWTSDLAPEPRVERIAHPGGPLVLALPRFRHECAFRIARPPAAGDDPGR